MYWPFARKKPSKVRNRSRVQRRWLEALESRHMLAGTNNVLLVIANTDFYFQEYNDTRISLEAAGFQVTLAATTTNLSTPHPNSGQGATSGQVTPHIALSVANAADYDAIAFVGGFGASIYQYSFNGTYTNQNYNNSPANKNQINQLINDFAAQDKIIAAICHAVSVLASARVGGVSPIAGKSVSSPNQPGPAGVINGVFYPSITTRYHIDANGATTFPTRSIGNPFVATDDVWVDGKIISAENQDSALRFGQVIAERILASAPAANQPPVNTVPTTRTAIEDTTLVMSNMFSIADADAGSASVQVRLDVTGGTVAIGASGITVSGNGSNQVVATGSIALLNTALAGLVFTPQAQLNGSGVASIQMTTNDLGNTGTGGAMIDVDSVGITIAPVNDAPVVNVPSAQTLNEDASLAIAGISLSDIDAGSSSVQVTFSSTHGNVILAANVASGINAAQIVNNGSMNVTVTAPIASINTTLANMAGLIYSPITNYSGSERLFITLNDLGNFGTGGALADVDSIAINIAAGNDAPVVTVPSNLTANEDTSTLVTGILISDIDSNSATVRVTLASTHGTLTVNANVAGGVNGGQLSGNQSTQITITAPLDAIRSTLADLAGLSYLPANNYVGSDLLTVTIDDLANGGSGGPLGDSRQLTINVLAVNDAPAITAPTLVGTRDDHDLVISGIRLDDIDAGTADVQLSLSVPSGTLSVFTSAVNGVTAAQVIGNGSTSVTLLAPLASINTTLASALGLVYSPVLGYDGSVSMSLTFDDLGNTGTGGAIVDQKTVVIGVNAMNDAPLLSPAAIFRLADVQPGSTANAGTLISELLDNASGGSAIEDSDIGALRGIAVVAADTSHGDWEFTLDGVTWLPVSNLSETSALLLPDDGLARLRFLPLTSFHSTIFNPVRPTITFRAWDQTTGGSGTTADTQLSGGNTAFSVDTATATVHVASQHFALEQTTLSVRGTLDGDMLIYQTLPDGTTSIQVNGFSETIPAGQVTSLHFDGRGGADVFYGMTDPATAELFQFTPSGLTIASAMNATVTGISTLVVYGDAGDSQTFQGSADSDVAYVFPNAAIVTTGNLLSITVGISTTTLEASDGLDVAVLIDSAGDDTFTGNIGHSMLVGQGYSIDARGFEQVYVFGSTGHDTASMFDSSADDVYYGLNSFSAMAGPGFLYNAIAFDRVRGIASGGTDIAVFYDSPGNDTFEGRPQRSTLAGSGYLTEVDSFDIVYALAFGGGNDRGELFDSAGNDTLIADGNVATLFAAGALIQLYNFDNITAHSTAGTDLAIGEDTDYLLTLDGPWL